MFLRLLKRTTSTITYTRAMSASLKYAHRLAGFEAPTVWHEFTPLAIERKAVNLGQGYPDWPCPQFVKDACITAVTADHNQYCRSGGHLRLVNAVAKSFSSSMGRTIDPLSEVAVSVGATEGMFACIQSIINDGDEVIVLEPAFDIYSAQLKMAGGVPKYVPLRSRTSASEGVTWSLDMEEFASKFTSKTRAVILNTPHNPTGKVFTAQELQDIANVVLAHPNVLVISDEVYQHLVYDGRKHVHIATLPGMWDRTITVSSAGKTFSVTGWKIGWVVGNKELVRNVMLANQWVQFSVATPLQEAIGACLEHAELPYQGFPNFYAWLGDTYTKKRDFLAAGLRNAGLVVGVPEGGFFIIADTSKIEVQPKYLSETTAAAPVMTRDWAFCRMLTIEYGVAAIPPSAFYCPEDKALFVEVFVVVGILQLRHRNHHCRYS